MPDNPITVPLPKDLPTNWSYGQTIGPNGTDVGLTQQYGYNYLMQQVNATQQAAEELGVGFTGLSGDNIPESAGSETSLSAALSNKADATPPQEYELPLMDGLTGYAVYSKDPFGKVLVTLQDIKKNDSSVFGSSNPETIGVLPIGYLPFTKINTTAVAVSAQGTPVYGIYQLWVEGDGSIRCYAQEGVQATMLRGILLFQSKS